MAERSSKKLSAASPKKEAAPSAGGSAAKAAPAPAPAPAKAAAPKPAPTPKVEPLAEAQKPLAKPSTKMGAARAMDPVERHRLIAEAAYHIALKRGLGPGDHMADWLAAERQVDAQLARK